MEVYLLVLSAYLLGSVPTGYIVGSLAGVDVRKAGSGNVGATNVARVVGKRQGIFTLVADSAKGFVPVVCRPQFRFDSHGDSLRRDRSVSRSSLSSVLEVPGRKGGGYGTGCFFGTGALGDLGLMAVFAVVLLATRFVSLSSMVAAAFGSRRVLAIVFTPRYR